MSADTTSTPDKVPHGDQPPPAERASQQPADGSQPHQPAETRTRAEYSAARHAEAPIQRHDAGRPAKPADGPMPSGNGSGPERQPDQSQRPATADTSANRAHQPAEPRSRAEYSAARHTEAPIQRTERQEQTPADANPDREKPDEPAKVYVDGHEIEITGDPHDGIWIEGLPGEPPNRTGDVLASPEEPEDSTSGKLFKKFVEKSDDMFDSTENLVTVGAQSMERPPTQAEVPVPSHRHTPEAQYHSPEAGSLATGVLAAGIVLWAGARFLKDHLRGAHHERDG